MGTSDLKSAVIGGLLFCQRHTGIVDIEVLRSAVFGFPEFKDFVGDGDRLIRRSNNIKAHVNDGSLTDALEAFFDVNIVIIDSVVYVRTPYRRVEAREVLSSEIPLDGEVGLRIERRGADAVDVSVGSCRYRCNVHVGFIPDRIADMSVHRLTIVYDGNGFDSFRTC